jgi:5'-3' exonuclease
MGICNFHTFIRNKYPASVKPKWSNHYDYIYIDINYCLHNIAYKSVSLDDVIVKLIEHIKNILKNNIPLKEVVLVTDGPAPFAKLFLQRKRRLGMTTKSTPLCTETQTQTQTDISVAPIIHGLTLHFTPGTNFMNTLEIKLADFVNYLKFIFSIKVTLLFSEPDEGEIKIKKILLANCFNNNSSHLIVSNDADVVLLACCTHTIGENKIYILTKMSIDSHTENYVINVNLLIDEHKKKFKSYNNWDIVGLSFLIGNDYIPKIAYNSFEKLWKAYKYALKLDTRGLILNLKPLVINRNFLINILLKIIKETRETYIKLFTLQYLYHPLYENYLEGYIWCLDMYTYGVCNNYNYIFKYQDDNVHPLGLIYTLYNHSEYMTGHLQSTIVKEPIDKTIYCILLLPITAKNLIESKYHPFLEEIKYIYADEKYKECKYTLLNIDDITEIIKKFNLFTDKMNL